MFVGGESVYFFETEDKIVKLISNVGNNMVPYSAAYGEKNIYYQSDQYLFIPYESIIYEQIREKISEMNETYHTYDFM